MAFTPSYGCECVPARTHHRGQTGGAQGSTGFTFDATVGHVVIMTMVSIAAIDTSRQGITFVATDTVYNVENIEKSPRIRPGRHRSSPHVTIIACAVRLSHELRWLSIQPKSTTTPYATHPKTATATVQGVLVQNLHQKLLWSLLNQLLSEYVGHSCSVQLWSNS